MNQRGLVVIPAYNESHSVVSIYERVQRALPDVDVLVIDDGSKDDTKKRLISAKVDHVRHPINLGYVEALRTGLTIALDDERPFVCFFDSDGQHRVEDLQAMIAEFQNSQSGNQPLDLVVGSRFLGGRGVATSMLRGFGNKFFCFLLQLLTGRRFTDVSNGLKVLSRRAAEEMQKLPLEDAHAELLLSAVQNNFRVKEHEVTIRPREQGQSMITALKALWYPLRTTLALLVLYQRRP